MFTVPTMLIIRLVLVAPAPRSIHLELVDVERVLPVLEQMRAMVGVHQSLGLHLDADLFSELARGCRPAILTRPDISPRQGELRPVGVLYE